MEVKEKRVTVVGLGNSGFNAATLLADNGAAVRVTDGGDNPDIRGYAKTLRRRGVDVEMGGHTKGFIEGSTLIVLSPGVDNSSPAVKWSEELKIPIIGEMELGYRFCEGRIIAVTGTNGKSTVTALIGKMLQQGGRDVVICGNIGNSLCGEIPRIKNDTWVSLEVSSFQLERTENFKPHIAVILNITDDHMDRYEVFEDYFKEKAKIFRNQNKDDFLVLNYDAENLRPLKAKSASRVLFYKRSDADKYEYIDEARLKGQHNVENILASILAATAAGIDQESIAEAIRKFDGLPHRFETVDTIDGVEYIDDSKGTTVDSTLRALESCVRPVILIAGGRDKNSDYSVIRDLVKRKVRHLVLIGEARAKIRKALGGTVEAHDAATMDEAVSLSRRLAGNNFIVLLSPMCSSFDMFKDYKERGEAFKNSVKSLKDSRERCTS